MLQERLDLVDDLENSGSSERMQELEDAFVQVARAYSGREAISYAAWREIGVSAAVLMRARHRPARGHRPGLTPQNCVSRLSTGRPLRRAMACGLRIAP